jgi:hypothetical protein
LRFRRAPNALKGTSAVRLRPRCAKQLPGSSFAALATAIFSKRPRPFVIAQDVAIHRRWAAPQVPIAGVALHAGGSDVPRCRCCAAGATPAAVFVPSRANAERPHVTEFGVKRTQKRNHVEWIGERAGDRDSGNRRPAETPKQRSLDGLLEYICVSKSTTSTSLCPASCAPSTPRTAGASGGIASGAERGSGWAEPPLPVRQG